jgi:hypothetical protein
LFSKTVFFVASPGVNTRSHPMEGWNLFAQEFARQQLEEMHTSLANAPSLRENVGTLQFLRAVNL